MKLPASACDCHVHIIGSADLYPMVENRQYTPGLATLDDLSGHMADVGLERAVLVQPSVYGTDNRCMLDGLRLMEGKGRGVAVLSDDISNAELTQLARQGVVGIRLNLESSNNQDAKAVRDSLKKWAERLESFGWHLQVYASFQVITASLDYFDGLSVPVVLDHFAMMPVGSGHMQGIEALLKALRRGNIYLKLSASYRIAGQGSDLAVKHLAARLLDANPDRLLWGSDWPHTNRAPGKLPTEVSPYRSIGAERLSRELAAWLPSAELAGKVLVENPARLYRF
ncbi:MAG TPA: amidohydrolase family protein [Eoetvoesiella sp.]